MSYSHNRFRHVLALVRIMFGLIFMVYAGTKLFDPTFFSTGFMQTLTRAEASSADWYLPVVRALWSHPGMVAVGLGMLDMFIGIGLLLGLATRPVSFVGMLYMANKIAITWNPVGRSLTAGQYVDAHLGQFAAFCLFMLFAFGHAGDVWGLGALYHAQREEQSRKSLRDDPQYSYLYEPPKDEEEEAAILERERKG